MINDLTLVDPMNKKLISIIITCVFLGVSLQGSILNSTPIDAPSTQGYQQPVRSDFLLNTYVSLLLRLAHKPSLATCIIHGDEVVWSHAYGYYDIENKKEATTQTLYLQASVSKTITATALMQLYERGLFDLNDDVNMYLPFSLRNPNHPDIPITIEMILSHRSSLADDNLYWICLSYLPGDPDVEGFPYPWLQEYLTPGGNAYSSSTWSLDKPGESYYYANVGFSLVAFLVEILSHQDFNEYCKQHIFQPLQMNTTGFRLRDVNIENVAVPYEFKNGGYFRHPQYGIHVLYPAITLRTSINDYSHFIIAHMNGGVWNGVRILNESTVELMHTAHFSPDDKYNYGLGWQVTNKPFEKTYGHSGGYVGALILVTIVPADDTAVLLFANALDSELHSTRLEWNAFSAINKALFHKAKRLVS
jgi:CubicO group peptidase (beta-lactamase class C family)